MDTTDSDIIKQKGALDAILASTLCAPIASRSVARRSKRWRESGSDRASFQRFEASRKQGAKAHCALADGSLRYADKPFSHERPRTISVELFEFYLEQDRMEAKK